MCLVRVQSLCHVWSKQLDRILSRALLVLYYSILVIYKGCISLDKFCAKWDANKHTKNYNMHISDITAEQSKCGKSYNLSSCNNWKLLLVRWAIALEKEKLYATVIIYCQYTHGNIHRIIESFRLKKNTLMICCIWDIHILPMQATVSNMTCSVMSWLDGTDVDVLKYLQIF